jgi:hypothetical protein
VLATGPARSHVTAGADAGAEQDGPSPPAFALARAIYASPLRPYAVDEVHARVLAGEEPAADAPADVRDLAQMRSTVRGDDASSRAVLDAIASAFHLKGIVVVEMLPPSSTPPAARARVYLTQAHAFDAAQYAPTEGTMDGGWSATVQSLQRTFPSPAVGPAQPAPTQGDESSTKRPFYTSPWFWGATVAAVLAGGAIYLATRDNGPRTIHLQLQVTK